MRLIQNKSVRFAALLCGAAMAAPMWAAPALAQGAEEASSNDIIVTAQRRSEKLVDVPMSVSVVSQDTLSNTGINSIRDLGNVTSGFSVGQSGSIAQSAIRGVTTTNAGAYENNVALFVDGLYQVSTSVLNMDLPNVQNIQILKGPQGTLYGRNATGGAILIDTIDPGRDWTGNIEATYGRNNDRRARGFVAGPLSEKVGISLAATYRKTDGYYKKASRTTPGQFETNNFLGLDQKSVRAKIRFEPTANFRATLGYSYIEASDPRGVIFTNIENVSSSYAAGTGRDTRPTGLGEVAGDVFINVIKQHEGSLKLELDTGIGTLRSVTGYTQSQSRTAYDFGGTYVPDSYTDGVPRERTWQENLDFTINAIDKLDLIIGGNYYNIKTDPQPGFATNGTVYLGPASYAPFTYPNPATTVVPLSDYRKFQELFSWRTKNAWAIFADATFHVTDRLTINVGGRYSEEKQDISALTLNYCTTTGGCTPTINGVVTPVALGGLTSVSWTPTGAAYNGINPVFSTPASKSSKYSKFTPRASIRYEIAPQTNIYASYSQGFRGGEWNGSVPATGPATWLDAKQETINAYEIGIKTSSPRFRAELAGFYYDYKNLQVSAVAFVNSATVVTLQNAPKAKIYGIDGSFDFDVTDNFKVRAGATWLHARYGDGFVWIGNGVNPAQPGFNTNSDPLKTFQIGAAANVAQDVSGMQMARAPDFTGFLGFEYNIPRGEGGLRFTANVKYTSSYVPTDITLWGGETLASYNARKAIDPTAMPVNNAPPAVAGQPATTPVGFLGGTPYANRASEQRARQSGYALVNASVTWTDPTNHYYVRVWGNNLTDVRYRAHYRAGTQTYIPMAEPLTFGGTIGYKF